MKITFNTLVFFLFTFPGISQIPNWEEIEVNENLNLESLTMDSLGFLWALSKEGLYKYDGYEVMEKLLPNSPSEKFNTLGINNEFQLLIGTSLGKMKVYDPNKAKIIKEQVFFDSLPISKINCENINNKCLAISYGNALSIRWQNEIINVSQEDLLISNEMYDVQFKQDGIVCASDQGIQVLKFRESNLISTEFPKSNQLLDVITTNMVDSEKGLWISYFADSLSLITTDTVFHFHYSQLGRISKMEYHNNSLFLSSENGLFELSSNSLIQKYPIEGRMPVKDFCFDKQGNVWIINGKSKLLRGNLFFQKFEAKIPQIQALAKVGETMWVGNKEGLFTLDNGILVNVLLQNITSLIYAHNLLWVGTFSQGLYVLDENGKVILHKEGWDGFDNQSILSMFIDKNDLFVSSLTGITRMKLDFSTQFLDIIEIKNLNTEIGEGYYYQIIKEGHKYLFATDGKGIIIMDSTGVKSINTFQDGLEIGSVYSLAADNSGVVWFSSSIHGLGFIKDGMAYRRRQKKSNFDNYTSLKKMSNGNILMIRTTSIDILNPKTNQIIYYEDEVGVSDEPPFLNSIDVNGLQSIFSHSDYIYLYNNQNQINFDPNVLINSVLSNFDTISNETVLKQDQNNIQVNFTGSWLTNPNKITYQYKLEGLDNTWRETKDRSASFSKLSPGNYQFLLRSSINDTFINSKIQAYSFKINRHFYNTWWFYGLIVGFLILIITKWRDHKKKRLIDQVETEKKLVESRLSNLKNQLNPHFLFNAFNTLMGLIEEDQNKSLVFVEKLTDFYRSVLVHGKNQLISLKEEIYLVNLFVDILNERFDQSLVINLPKNTNNILIPPLTLQLLIENAVKHNQIGQGKKLPIDIFQEGDYIVVKNKLSPKMYSVKSTGSGLDNIKKRYLLLNSKAIQIKKTQDFFEVRLPIIQTKS